VTKKLRWARYVACLRKTCVEVSEGKGHGKRHVEDVEVDGEKAKTWYLYSSFTLEDKLEEVPLSLSPPIKSVRNSRCAEVRKISTPPPQPPRGPITNRSARRKTDYPIRTTRRRWEDNNKVNLHKTRIGGMDMA